MNILGIDIGGTKTSVCVGNTDGDVRAHSRFDMLDVPSVDDYMPRVAHAAQLALDQAGLSMGAIERIGISAPGPLSVARGVIMQPANNPGWSDVPIVALAEAAFDRPVVINNDANAGALAEKYFGRHRAAAILVFLTNSTGMGGGIINNGELVQGVTDMAGELGHYCLDAEGPDCPCGLHGCFELYVGGRAVAERLKARIRDEGIETAMIDQAGGDIDKITLQTLTAAARAGDTFALSEWDAYTEHMAHGIGNIIQMLNPAVILLGTVAVNEGEFLLGPVREKLARYTWKWPREACVVEASSLGARIGDLATLAVARHTA